MFVPLPAEDNFTVELNFHTMFREEYIATSIAQGGYSEEIVGYYWASVGDSCCRWQFV